MFDGPAKEATGKVFLEGEEVTVGSVEDHIRVGLALIPEDRQRDGLVQGLYVTDNMTLSSLWKFIKGFHIQRDKLKKAVLAMIRRLSVKSAGAQAARPPSCGRQPAEGGSGQASTHVAQGLLLDEPTRGIDVGAKAEIFDIMIVWSAVASALFSSLRNLKRSWRLRIGSL